MSKKEKQRKRLKKKGLSINQALNVKIMMNLHKKRKKK